jgi:hypothetical protein
MSMTETVPKSLLAQVSMTKHGPDIESQTENRILNLAISQLLLYNFHSKASNDTGDR